MLSSSSRAAAAAVCRRRRKAIHATFQRLHVQAVSLNSVLPAGMGINCSPFCVVSGKSWYAVPSSMDAVGLFNN